jgi:hypothetical protein
MQKKSFRRVFFSIIIILIYLGLTLFSLLLFIRPGASIFHYELKLDPNQIRPDEGYAYRYPLNVNPFFFEQGTILFYENDLQLVRETPNLLVDMGGGLFSVTDPRSESYYLYFAPLENSDPRTNGNTYTIFLRLFFLTRSFGLVLFLVMLLWLVRYSRFIIANPQYRGLPLVYFQVTFRPLVDFCSPYAKRLLDRYSQLRLNPFNMHRVWSVLLLWVIVSAYTYILLEWLFFITKQSFMAAMQIHEKVELLLQAGFFLALPALLTGLLLYSLDRLLALIGRNGVPLFVGTLLPAVFIAGIALLLVDNFTYTVFTFGIVSSGGIWRGVYGVGFLLAIILIHRQILKVMGLWGKRSEPKSPSRFHIYTPGGLLAVSLVLVLVRFDFGTLVNTSGGVFLREEGGRPNIILFGSDGVNAAHLSAYGYERGTTPTLERLADTSLFAENAFTNSAHSTGSITSILTGKLPTETRVLYPPDILQKEDASQHLPGILKRAGYYSIELGMHHYVDAYKVNMRGGFDEVNGVSLNEASLFQSVHGSTIDGTVYFFMLLSERITERIKHIFYIKEMENPYITVTEPVGNLDDEIRLERLLELVYESEKPFFAHVHMMGTHGAKFFPTVQQYSVGKHQTDDWMVDFYDDAILTYDASLQTLLDALVSSGKMDNTILIIYTDHGMGYTVNERIPLLVRFPNGEYSGKIKSNVQSLDIAPTILDYLNLPIPGWMEGHSLIQGEPPYDRLIFATGTYLASVGNLISEQVKPPFFQFSLFNVIQCDKTYYINFVDRVWIQEEVAGHTEPCPEEAMLTTEEIRQGLAEHLTKNKFDISTLP